MIGLHRGRLEIGGGGAVNDGRTEGLVYAWLTMMCFGGGAE